MAQVIKQQTQVFNKPVGVIRTSGGAQQLGQAISGAAGDLARQAYNLAAEDAQKRGIDVAQSVEEKKLMTFDPETGKPEVFSPPPAFGRIAATAYQDIIDKRFSDSMKSELQLKAQEIALKYQYNPDAYDDVFSDYIGAMSENATGKYKEFIESTGADYLARTKLNIQSRVQTRVRENLAQSALNGIDQGSDNAYDSALAGGFIAAYGEETSSTQEILEAEVGNVSKAVATNLLKVGADKKARDQISLSTARGGVEYLISKTNTSSERNALELAIRTRGNETSGISDELFTGLEALLPYIDSGNVNQVLSHAGIVNASYDAVERDETLAAEQNAKRLYTESVINGGTSETLSVKNAVDAFDLSNPIDMKTAILAANQSHRVRADALAGQLRSEVISEPQYRAGLAKSRQETLRPFLLEAASEGNQETLSVAINNPTEKNMQGLSENQKNFVRAITNSTSFNVNEDMGAVTTLLGRTVDQNKAERESQQKKYSNIKDVDSLVSRATNGSLSDDEIEKARAGIDGMVGNGFSAIEASSEKARLDRALGNGIINSFSRSANSSDMNLLASYIGSSGQRTPGMSDLIVNTGDAIRKLTDEGDIQSLTGKITSMNTRIIKSEKDLAEKTQLYVDNFKLMNGTLSNTTESRQFSQDFFDGIGVDLGKFDFLPKKKQEYLYPIIASTPPAGLVQKLKDIESGIEVVDSEGYLNLFARLDKDVFSNGMTRSRLGNALGDTTLEQLRDIQQIRLTGGLTQSVSEIAINQKNARTNPSAKLALDLVLSDANRTLSEYALSLSGNDRIVANELTPLIDYLARSGKSKSQIDDRIATILNGKYGAVEYIADPAFPLGTLNRSRHALQAVLPDDDAVDEFVSRVNSELPAGYSLNANEINAAKSMNPDQAQTQEQYDAATNDSPDLKQVYLVPDPRTSGVGYFAYEVDETNSLVPLIYDVTPISRKGETSKPVRTFPFFDESLIDDYNARVAQERNDLIRQETEAAEELALKRREMKIQSQFKSIRDVTKAPSLWWQYYQMEAGEGRSAAREFLGGYSAIDSKPTGN